jgi:hypothetical protein
VLPAVGHDAEDRLVLVGARAVHDLHEPQLAHLGVPVGLREGRARRLLQVCAFPALVLGVGGRQRLIGGAQLGAQVGVARLGAARGGDRAAGREQQQDDDDRDDDDGERAQGLNSTRFA